MTKIGLQCHMRDGSRQAELVRKKLFAPEYVLGVSFLGEFCLSRMVSGWAFPEAGGDGFCDTQDLPPAAETELHRPPTNFRDYTFSLLPPVPNSSY